MSREATIVLTCTGNLVCMALFVIDFLIITTSLTGGLQSQFHGFNKTKFVSPFRALRCHIPFARFRVREFIKNLFLEEQTVRLFYKRFSLFIRTNACRNTRLQPIRRSQTNQEAIPKRNSH